MIAGVNYNSVWVPLGNHISTFDVNKSNYHIAKSDTLGIFWAVGGLQLQGRQVDAKGWVQTIISLYPPNSNINITQKHYLKKHYLEYCLEKNPTQLKIKGINHSKGTREKMAQICKNIVGYNTSCQFICAKR